MKKLLTLVGAALFAWSAQAADVELVVEKMDNAGAVQGQTFRVYAKLAAEDHSLHAVFAEGNSPMHIQTDGQMYNHPYGSYSTANIHSEIINIDPTVSYDSWVTINAENSTANDFWQVGIDFNSFEETGNLNVVDGAWFILPTDEMSKPVKSDLVLLMQVTVDGTTSGSLNLQGWDADRNPWQARGLTFSTANAEVFGCTSAFAENYDADATFDDGSCENKDQGQNSLQALVADKMDNTFTLQPNPVTDDYTELVFQRSLTAQEGDLFVEITDPTGKLVLSEQIALSDARTNQGGVYRLNFDLASGVYNVTLRNNQMSQTQRLLKK